ncbi:MAG TPA: hypothetical protein VFQ54_07230 [Thermomicrobiales bacterium]|nr:hypothetical protein [Thermomicrobiales bacterium]
MMERDRGAVVDRVDAIRLGGWQYCPGYEIYWMDMQAKAEPLALVSLVIRSGEHVVLVNCGPDPSQLPPKPAGDPMVTQQHVLESNPDQYLEVQLATLGLSPADVTHVICTPFQIYSLGNLRKLTNAEICLSRTGWIDFHAPRWKEHPHDKRWSCIPRDVLVNLVTDAWPRVRLVHDEVIVPGVETFWTGVHHRASLAVKIQTTRGIVIAGDAFMRLGNIERRHPIGINESMEEALTTYDRVAREADIIVPLYDPAVWERHPGGRIA